MKDAVNQVLTNVQHTEVEKERITFIQNQTGWDEKTIVDHMNKAKEIGISNFQYATRWMFTLTDEEIEEFAPLIEEKQQLDRQDRDFFVNVVAHRTGWSEDQARERMTAASQKGVSFLKYAQKGCWTYNNEELADYADFLENDRKRVLKNKDEYIDTIMSATNWTRGKVELEVYKSNLITGCSYEDFAVFRFWEMSLEEQKTFVTLGTFNKVRLLYNDSAMVRNTMDDKAAFNTCFDSYIRRKWFLNEDLSYERFLKLIEGMTSIIVKPIDASQGKGIVVYDCSVSLEEKKRIYETIMEKGLSIVEEYIVQHEELMKFCDTSVNTIRIITMNENGKCKFLYACLRMGTGGVVDNFHSGGVSSAINMETGVLTNYAFDLKGNRYENHPYSGTKIAGFKIPHWDKIIETCERIYNQVNGINLIGWDFAITPEDIELIEGNPGASYIIAQIPCTGKNVGLYNLLIGDYLFDYERYLAREIPYEEDGYCGHIVSAFGEIELTEVKKENEFVKVPRTLNEYPIVRIGRRCFIRNTKLQEIDFGPIIKSIGQGAFYRCDSLTHIMIPGNVKIIERGSFRNCENLEKVILEDGVMEIAQNAFRDNPNLKEIAIPNSVKQIGSNILKGADEVVIICDSGSYAERYARENFIRCRRTSILV